MAYTYWLPDESGNKVDYTTESNSVIIVGANGAGKSKLGAWIEQRDFEGVYRTGAQRSLNFSEAIIFKPYSDAIDMVHYGNVVKKIGDNHQGGRKWNWGTAFTTTLIDNFNDVLSALLTLNANETSCYFDECKKAQELQLAKPDIPERVIDKLFSIWNEVLPQRKLALEDSKFFASFIKNGNEVKYSATEMSDGERSVLYLAAQVLCVPKNKVLVIDEPELHLHPSIMNRLWKALEKYREDCLFIYITHDLQFASMHNHADKIWIREYDGQNWKLQKIEDKDLPEDLLLEIMGSRKNIIFVEGERNSYDTQLYSELYPDYHIVPCGSCTQVIARTKAFRNNMDLHDCEVYGIIDRDYRSEYEINALKQNGVYSISVAEVENLFLVEELIRVIATHMGKNPDDVFSKIRDFVIFKKFYNCIQQQIRYNVISEIKYQLSCIEISKSDDASAKSSFDSAYHQIDYDNIKNSLEVKYRSVQRTNDYGGIIRVFNEKNISKSIGSFFGINNRDYCQIVIDLLRGIKHDEIVSALSPYLPTEIPR